MRGAWMLLALIAALAIALAARPAWAVPGPFYLTLNNVSFDDGGTASGYLLVNSYGFISTPRDLETTAGTMLGATSYLPGMPVNNTSQVFDFFLADYSGDLHLEVAAALDAGSPDALVLAGASYECIDQCATRRQVVAGSLLITDGSDPVYVPPTDALPEPASIGLLGMALGGIAATRRRRPDKLRPRRKRTGPAPGCCGSEAIGDGQAAGTAGCYHHPWHSL